MTVWRAYANFEPGNNGSALAYYCPGKEAAMVSIVVSLPCTAYQCGAFITFWYSPFINTIRLFPKP